MDELEYEEGVIVQYGKLMEIYKEVVYLKSYVEAMRRLGDSQKITETPSLPRQLYLQVVNGSTPRLGPVKLKGQNPYILEGLNAVVKSPREEPPIHAIVDMRKGIKVLLGFERKRPVVGIDIGVRHIATVVGIVGTKVRKVRFFDDRNTMYKLMEYTGTPQGLGKLESLKPSLYALAKRIVEFVESLHPQLVILEDLRSVEGRVGRALRLIQENIESSLYVRGVRYKKRSAFNTSKVCSRCGYRKGEVIGSIFVCPACGLKADRDFNAALNLAIKGYYS